jgi:glutathione S-transferase
MAIVHRAASPPWILWGSELSPFALKLQALLAYARQPYRWWPRQGRRWPCWRTALQIHRAKRRRSVRRYPQASPWDEYPLVPYLIAGGEVHYDTSGLAMWMDAHHLAAGASLYPREPLLRFVAQLVDETFDELGLYLVHHNRWVLSATTNHAGRRLGEEFRPVVLPGLGGVVGRRFARRQVRRLPYLFSVAPPGFTIPDWPVALTPPSRAGFPPTHELLDQLWRRYLQAIEAILSRQPFLLGERFCIADASVYGQLAMNLSDASAAHALSNLAPRTHAWLSALHSATAPVGAASGDTSGAIPPAHPTQLDQQGELRMIEAMAPLLELIGKSFVPLMEQNAMAYEQASGRGERLFNESAFQAGRALYDGELCGHPFRSVAKTFQVRVWSDLCRSWNALEERDRARLRATLPDFRFRPERRVQP